MNGIFYNTYSSFLRKRFGTETVKIPINIGTTCPNRDGKLSYKGCTYCSESGSGTGSRERAAVQAESFIRKRRKSEFAYIAYFQSFTNMYGEIRRIIEEIESVVCIDSVVGVSIATRPDETEPLILKKLADISLDKFVQIEIGLESANDLTLEAVNRHHSAADFISAVKTVKNEVRDAHVVAHVIIGLPGEGMDDYIRTVEFVNRSGADGVKFHHLYIHRNSQMKKDFDAGKVELLSEDSYTDILLNLIERLDSKIVIHRTKSSLDGKNLTAPFWTLDRHFHEKLLIEAERKRTYQGKYYGNNDFNCW